MKRTIRKSGRLLLQRTGTEPFQAYVPKSPPSTPSFNMEQLYPLLDTAMASLGKLNNLTDIIPNSSLFIYMYVRKEALLSSQIEGTQSSFAELILFEHKQKYKIAKDDVEEVSNYVKAAKRGIRRLEKDTPLSLRLIKELHSILLSGTRGKRSEPGQIRRSQNWIGGSRPGNALFVPPPVGELGDCLSNLEKFMHSKRLPSLVKAALVHVQFETIHPFLDGNGRLGRLLIILLLINDGLLDQPILYISLYLKQHRTTYYRLLQEVREKGTWETWIEFFLKGVIESSNQGIKTAKRINALFVKDLEKIHALSRTRFTCEEVFDYLKELPQVTVKLLVKELGLSAPTIRAALNHLIELGIVSEITGQPRDRVYVYRKYLDMLEEGTEPL